jgi:nucleotide-binding universal stress UspA family protein
VSAPVEDTAANKAEQSEGPRIVVGYSSRPEGRAALRRSLSEAALRGAALIVLHGPDDDLDELTTDLETAGVSYELKATQEGSDVAEDLIELAEDADAAFIVIGLRRRSPVGKLLLGSNAQRVLLDASCPVLAVKAG